MVFHTMELLVEIVCESARDATPANVFIVSLFVKFWTLSMAKFVERLPVMDQDAKVQSVELKSVGSKLAAGICSSARNVKWPKSLSVCIVFTIVQLPRVWTQSVTAIRANALGARRISATIMFLAGYMIYADVFAGGAMCRMIAGSFCW